MAVVGLLGVLPACEVAEKTDRAISNAISRSDTPPPPAKMMSGEPEVRVRINKGVRSAKIEAPTRLVVRAFGGGTPRTFAGPLAVTGSAQGLVIKDGSGKATTFPFGTDVEILLADTRQTSGVARISDSISVDGLRHPGFVAIRARWQDYPEQFDVIGVMGVEAYLPGVLVGELPREWPRQAFEAQSVAARTYVLHERERAMREGRAFDVEDSTADQVYNGSVTLPMAFEAANATRGWVITERGGFLRAYYSSTCGGRPASAGKVWPTGPGYEFNLAGPVQGKARQHACQKSPHYRWEVTRSDEELSQRLRAWGRQFKHPISGVTRVRQVQVREWNDAKRPSVYKVVDDRGREFSMTAEELRNASNQSVGNLPAISDQTRVRSGDLEVEIWADVVRIRGRGWGHGVGMCQWCARGFAELGMDWRTMLREFYPGAEVKKLY